MLTACSSALCLCWVPSSFLVALQGGQRSSLRDEVCGSWAGAEGSCTTGSPQLELDTEGLLLSLGPFPNWGWGLEVKETESCFRLFYFSPGWVLLRSPCCGRWAARGCPRGGRQVPSQTDHLLKTQFSFSVTENWNGLYRFNWKNWNDTHNWISTHIHAHTPLFLFWGVSLFSWLLSKGEGSLSSKYLETWLYFLPFFLLQSLDLPEDGRMSIRRWLWS